MNRQTLDSPKRSRPHECSEIAGSKAHSFADCALWTITSIARRSGLTVGIWVAISWFAPHEAIAQETSPAAPTNSTPTSAGGHGSTPATQIESPGHLDETQNAPAKRGTFERVFVYGGSQGEPSEGKWITLGALYTLSAGSLALGAVVFAEHLSDHRKTLDFRDAHPGEGPCFDLRTTLCGQYTDLLGKEQASATLAAAGLGLAGAFLLSAVVTAEVWRNLDAAPIRAQIGWLPGQSYAGLSGVF